MQREAASYGGPQRTHMLSLEQDTARAVELLRRLTALDPGIKHNQPEVVGDDIANAAGVAITFTMKAGLGLSGMTGRGFVLRKLQLSDSTSGGAIMWTAPLFFNVRGAGLGLTLGFATVDSLLLVESESALDAYYKTQASFDVDMELATGKGKGGKLPGTPLNIPNVRSGFKSWEYSISSGALLDISMRGGSIHRDEHLMRKLYGQDVLMTDIVAGRVPLPPEMMPLYTELQQLTSQSARLLPQ